MAQSDNHPDSVDDQPTPVSRVTVSELIDYVQCPHRYFLLRSIPTKTPPQPQLTALELGTIVHRSAEQVLRPLIAETLTPLAIDEALRTIPERLSESARRHRAPLNLGALDLVRLEAAAHHLERRLRRDLALLWRHGGKIAGLEWAIEIEHEGVAIRGRIDRVDELPNATGGSYWLWDLKSGRSTPALGEPRAIQLLLYGDALGWDKVEVLAFEALLSDDIVGLSKDPRLLSDGVKAVVDLPAALGKERQLVSGALAGLRAHDYAPRPFAGDDTCGQCNVRGLCRYSADAGTDALDSVRPQESP